MKLPWLRRSQCSWRKADSQAPSLDLESRASGRNCICFRPETRWATFDRSIRATNNVHLAFGISSWQRVSIIIMAAQLEVNACEITKLILQYFEETDLSKSCSACATETQVQNTTQRVSPPNITVVHPSLPVLSCVLSCVLSKAATSTPFINVSFRSSLSFLADNTKHLRGPRLLEKWHNSQSMGRRFTTPNKT